MGMARGGGGDSVKSLPRGCWILRKVRARGGALGAEFSGGKDAGEKEAKSAYLLGKDGT